MKSAQNKNANKKDAFINPKKENSYSVYLIIAFCFPVLLYLQTINFGFTDFDDDNLIKNNISFLSHLGNVHQAFLTDAFIDKSSSFYRPLQTLSFMADIKLSGGNNTWMYHLSNLLFLGLIACLLFLLFRRFLIPPKLALLSTLIYCVHPLFVSSVAWIPARGDLMLSFFSLLSFLFFTVLLKKKKMIYLFLNWVAFTLALFCKETAALLPFLFILYYFLFSSKKLFDKKSLFPIILYAISGVFWFWLRSRSIGGLVSNQNDNLSLIQVMQNLRTIPESLTEFFLPFNIAPIQSFSVLKTLTGLGIIVLIVIVFLKVRKRIRKEKVFCFLWFIILMLPPLFYKNPNLDYLNHRFLLPLIGIMLFLQFIFPNKWLVKGDIKVVWFLVSLLLSSLTFIISRSYSDPLTFYNYAVSQNPNSALAYCNRGYVKYSKNDFQGAVEDENRAIAIYPEYANAYNNRSMAKLNMGDKLGAIEDENKSIDISPNFAGAYINRGTAKLYLRDNFGAIKDFDKAISINPNDEEAYINKGGAMGSIGNFKEAIINFNKAIEIDSEYFNAYYNRAITKYSIKDFKGVMEDCKIMLKLNPNSEKVITLNILAQKELQKINN
jgi:tetratricopeptide (TPR) repeat protein